MTLPPHEQDVLDRLEKIGNPLGWKPAGRDAKGHAVLQIVQSGGKGPDRLCAATLTPQGVVHNERRLHSVTP